MPTSSSAIWIRTASTPRRRTVSWRRAVLCRRIAQGHGGMLVAESAVGKGTVFTLSLPNARSTDLSLSDRRFDYAGGFDHVLMELSDALPSRAFLQKYLD